MNFWKKIESWELWLLVGSVLVLGLYAWQYFDLENLLKPQSPTPVHMGGNIMPGKDLPQTQIVDIPDYVYDTLNIDTTFKRYLTGNHKYVLVFVYPRCSYSLHRTLEYLFRQEGWTEYYRKRIINTGAAVTWSCPSSLYKQCATNWVYQNCLTKVCIFNPQRKQAVIDSSQDARQLNHLLEKYKEW
ncbi:MAG: hypothetical protein IKP96_00030 [Elusimicrobiaceae bacterium]|nr:hypothetical protein [Elusimicrobiaceae bacterium]